MDVRFLGHSCFSLSDGDTTVVIDPFLTGNPKAAVSADEIDPTTILLTHGHADHIGDTVAIAKRTGATVTAIAELAGEIGGEDVEVRDPNLGGTIAFDWGWVKLVPAWHTSTTPNGTINTPAGLVGARTVIPCHYNTFPPIEADAQAFKADVESATSAGVVVLDPGETHST